MGRKKVSYTECQKYVGRIDGDGRNYMFVNGGLVKKRLRGRQQGRQQGRMYEITTVADAMRVIATAHIVLLILLLATRFGVPVFTA